MNFKKAIIDCDPIIYSCGFSIEYVDHNTDIVHLKEGHTIQNAKWNIDSTIKKITEATHAEERICFLTGSGKDNYRFSIFPNYKANRAGTRRPIYYKELRDYVIQKYDAKVTVGEEADDACSIEHMKHGSNEDEHYSIICSIDKDFNNTPGWHYNYRKEETYYVSHVEALRNFYLQILTGDTSDGIPRIKKGWRKKEVEERLKEANTEEEFFGIVSREISKVFETEEVDEVNKEILWRGRLVWLRRKENEMWELLK